jgi:hypothetical protein
MKKLIQLILITIGFSLNSYNQIISDTISFAQLPKGLAFNGNFIKCISWRDKLGLNYLVIYETDIVRSKIAKELIKTAEIDYISRSGDTLYDDIRTSYRDKEIWGINYVIRNDSTFKLWEIYDFIKECYGSVKLNFEEPPIVTNLNNSEIYQSWLIYKLSCNSDVSPAQMKIIMHIGNKKYAVRGTTQVALQGKLQYPVSERKFDKEFEILPKEIINFANELWEKHKIDNY